MHHAFCAAFRAAPPPDYSLHPSGHAAELAWWRKLAAAALTSLGGPAAQLPPSPRPTTSDLPTCDSPRDPPSFHSYFTSLLTHYAEPAAWSLYPEVPEFLAAASRHGPLAVVSNFDDRLAPILHGLGIGPAFDHIVTSAEARARKPDPAIFALALQRLPGPRAPAEVAHCGDSHEADFEGAAAFGLRAFHLQRPAQNLLDFLAFCRS
jgi:putative hydrolase of the HAD superfamily